MTSSTVRALGNKSYTWGGGYWPGEQGLYLERGLNNTGPGNKVKKVQVWGTRVIPVEGVKYHWSGGRGLNITGLGGGVQYHWSGGRELNITGLGGGD